MQLMPFSFEPLARGVLVSNSFGGWLALSKTEFSALKAGSFQKDKKLTARLSAAGFIRERLDLEGLARDFGGLCKHTFSGPSLHILVVTLQCNHACVYCRAVKAGGFEKAVMTLATAKKSVDMAFCSPNNDIALEFQGGEALINWPVVQGTILYAQQKNKRAQKNLLISVVTNLSLMDEEKFSFLRAHGVGLCTSLDGPAFIHDANRLYAGGSSQKKAVYWLEKARQAGNGGEQDALPSALMTTTRLSLSHHKEIVDTYRALGLGGIFLRPLSPIGYARSVWKDIGYGPEEYAAFYRSALEYIIGLNQRGEHFVERNAALLARKALRKEDPNFLDLRSPCGAATGQLAYNWDGGVYTCDEGRMTGAGGDDFFRLGSVHENSYREVIESPPSRVCAMASCLDSQPACSRCAWKPWCGVCPVHNYDTQGSPWGNITGGDWCRIQKGVFAAVFEALARPASRRVIESWL
jgi:His-Xaa-Ser system radical SAM maturase HxsB